MCMCAGILFWGRNLKAIKYRNRKAWRVVCAYSIYLAKVTVDKASFSRLGKKKPTHPEGGEKIEACWRLWDPLIQAGITGRWEVGRDFSPRAWVPGAQTLECNILNSVSEGWFNLWNPWEMGQQASQCSESLGYWTTEGANGKVALQTIGRKQPDFSVMSPRTSVSLQKPPLFRTWAPVQSVQVKAWPVRGKCKISRFLTHVPHHGVFVWGEKC